MFCALFSDAKCHLLPSCSVAFEALDMPVAVISVTLVFGWTLLLMPRVRRVGVDRS